MSRRIIFTVVPGILAVGLLAAGIRLLALPPAADTAPGGEAAAWQSQKPEFLAIARRIASSTNGDMGRGNIDSLQAFIANPGAPMPNRTVARGALAMEFLRLGDIDAALEQLSIAFAQAADAPGPAAALTPLYRVRGLAHLRRAEIQNCIARHNSDCCIFPLKDGAIHAVREPAANAKADFLAYLGKLPARPKDAVGLRESLTAAWLLNIACMALDEYPDGVPAALRIPIATFESGYDIRRFIDVAPQAGLDTFNRAGGVIVDDFDADGLLDVVSSSCDPEAPMKAFRSRGDGTFEDVSSAWRLDDQLGVLNIVSVDYNNDGRLDVLVPRGAWMHADGIIRHSLLRHEEDHTFTDVTRQAGLLGTIGPSQTAVWADFDNDGWLDLFLGHESPVEVQAGTADIRCNLYRNNADGTFTDVTRAAGVSNSRFCKAAAAGDYDNDGDMDLYVSNIGRNRLYRNNGNMTFTDMAEKLAVFEPAGRSFATWFFDYDNDGNLDIWVGAYEGSVADVAADYLRAMPPVAVPCLYHNNGNGTFTNVTSAAGLHRVLLPMGANFGDFDNDGWLDMYLGTGDPKYESLMPNVALRNDGGTRFQDVTQSGGFGHLQKGHGTAFADMDNDGDQDLYHMLGGFFPDDRFRNVLFENPGHGHHFLAIELVGVRSNRMAVGARITVTLDTPDGTRELHRAAGCVSSFGGSPRRQEIGLAGATAIRSLEIWWPATGQRQMVEDVPLDSFIRITEGAAGFERLAPPSFTFGP